MKHDPIEKTKEYEKTMEEVDPILEKEFPPDRIYFGMCHAIWNRKRTLLEERGIQWRSPAEMNPHIIFD